MRNALSMCHYKSFRFGNQSKRRTKTNELKKAAAAAATLHKNAMCNSMSAAAAAVGCCRRGCVHEIERKI